MGWFMRLVQRRLGSHFRRFHSRASLKYLKQKRATFLKNQSRGGFDATAKLHWVRQHLYKLHRLNGPRQWKPYQDDLTTGFFHNAKVKTGYSHDYNKSVLVSHTGTQYTVPGDTATTVTDARDFASEDLAQAIIKKKINKVATLYTGSLNTFSSSKSLGLDVAETLEASVPGLYLAGTVNAETGLYQYGEAAYNGYVNEGRENYMEAIVSAIYFNYLGKIMLAQQNVPIPRTISMSHSWGCPSFVEEYSFTVVALYEMCQELGLDFYLPHDHIVMVDPRYPWTCGDRFKDQIAFLRGAVGVQGHVIKDTASLTSGGFDTIESWSGNQFSTEISDKAIQVDSYKQVSLGHAFKNHLPNIEELLKDL